MFTDPMLGFALLLYFSTKLVNFRVHDGSMDSYYVLNISRYISKYQSSVIDSDSVDVA